MAKTTVSTSEKKTQGGDDLIGGIVAGIGSAVSGAFNYASQSKANRINNYWSKKNYEMQQQQLQYQKYLNNNQIQIQSADAQKAGINPMAMNSSTLSSGNYSNVDSNQQAPQLDLSGLIQAAISEDSNRNQKNIADNANETSEKNVKTQTESNEKMNSDRLKSEEDIAKYKEEQTTLRQQIQIAFDDKRSKEDRDNAMAMVMKQLDAQKEIASGHDSTNKLIADSQLKEQQYQFDKKQELAMKELASKTRAQNIDSLTKAYKQWCIMNNIPYDIKQGKSVSSYLVEQFERGAKALNDLTGDQNRFWKWYIENYSVDDSSFRSSSVRRQD